MSFKLLPSASEKTCGGHRTQQSVYFGAFPVSAAHFNNSLWTEQHHKCFRLKCFSQPAAPIKPLPFTQPREGVSVTGYLRLQAGWFISLAWEATVGLLIKAQTASVKRLCFMQDGRQNENSCGLRDWDLACGYLLFTKPQKYTKNKENQSYSRSTGTVLLSQKMDFVESTFKESLVSVTERKWSLWFKKNLSWTHRPAARADHRWPVFVRSLVFSSCSICGWINYEKRPAAAQGFKKAKIILRCLKNE